MGFSILDGRGASGCASWWIEGIASCRWKRRSSGGWWKRAIPRLWKCASGKLTERSVRCWWIALPESAAIVPEAFAKREKVLQRLEHLLGIEPLTREQISFILDQAAPFQEFQKHPLKKLATLRGKTIALA